MGTITREATLAVVKSRAKGCQGPYRGVWVDKRAVQLATGCDSQDAAACLAALALDGLVIARAMRQRHGGQRWIYRAP